MAGREPGEIWDETLVEGCRRLDRTATGLLATGFVGGLDVMLGIVALVVTAGAMAIVLPHEVAHVIGSLAFGIGFVFIVVGRSELFTENFLVPISPVLHGQRSPASVARLWAITFAGNLACLLLLALILTRAGLVPPEALDAAGRTAETFAHRDWIAALLSAVVAGATMTLMTWLVHAADGTSARILIALLVGFILAAPSLNHAVVSFGEMGLGILADRGDAGWGDLAQNLPLAIAGNLLGGFVFVTAVRGVQVRGEPEGDPSARG